MWIAYNRFMGHRLTFGIASALLESRCLNAVKPMGTKKRMRQGTDDLGASSFK